VPRSSVAGRSILFAVAYPFHPPYQGGSARSGALIDHFRRNGWSVTVAYCYLGRETQPDYAAMAARVDGLYVYLPTAEERAKRRVNDADSWCPEPFAALVRDLCIREQPGVLLAQRVFLTKCFEGLGHAAQPLKVLDADNLYTDRDGLFARIPLPYVSFSTQAEDEARALRRADLVLAIQPEEAEIMRAMAPEQQVLVVPHAVSAPACPHADTHDILVVGAYTLTNIHGLQQFLDRAWDGVRRGVPDARLLVAGEMGRVIRSPTPGVDVLGVVEDLDGLYRRASVVINPQLVGTGLSTKTVDALVRGKCLVTTPAGGRGIAGIERHARVVADMDELGVAVTLLLQRPEERRRLEHAARAARERFAPSRVYSTLERTVLGLVSDIRRVASQAAANA